MMTSEALAQTLRNAFALHQAGRLAEAEPLYRAILKASPGHFDTLHMLGVLRLQLQDAQSALDLIGRAVTANPRSAPALNNHGNALRTLNRLDEALRSYDRATKADPNYIEAVKNRGDVLQMKGRHTEAIACYDSVLARSPHADAFHNRAASLQKLERTEEALRDYEAALRLKPDYALAWQNRGKAFEQLERYEDAIASYSRAIALAPHNLDARAGSASALRGAKRYGEALAACDDVLAVQPDHIAALNVRGVILRDTLRFPEALACFDRVIALKADYLEAHVNRGTTLHEMGRDTEALAAFDVALALEPEHVMANWNRALTLLMAQKFHEGWDAFAWRLKSHKLVPRASDFKQPVWTGNDPGGTLLLWGEQGVGEEILNAGMAVDLLARGLPIVWDADVRLHPLIARSYPGVRLIPRTAPSHPATQEPEITAQISTASLGRYVRPDLTSFPSTRRAYLKADAAKTESYRARLTADGATRVIGVSWISRNAEIGAGKSTSLMDWAPLWQAAGPNARFVDLQYGDTTAERNALPFALAHMDDLDLFNDLDGLAALIAACDLVITVSNSTAHLAGALGVPLWVMLSKGSGKLWYWGGTQDTTPWYPSALIFRQKTPGDWGDVLQAMTSRLAKASPP